MLLKLLVITGLVLIFSLLIGGVYCCIHFIKYYRYWEKRGVKVDKNFLLVNGIYDVFSGKATFGKFLSDLYKHHDAPYFGFYMLGRPGLLIRSPQIIKNIATVDFNYFENRSFSCEQGGDPMVAKSVFLARNPEWKYTRAKLNLLFSSAKIKSTIPAIVDTAKRMRKYLERHDNEIIDFNEVGENYIVNLGPLIFLGINSHCSFDEPENTIKHVMKNVFGKGAYQAFAFFMYIFLPRLVPFINIKIGNFDYMRGAIKDTVTYKESNGKGKGISDLLLNHNNESNDKNENFFDENWHVAQALTLIIAGFLPPTSLFAFSLHELSRHPECQEKLRKEILENFPNDEEPCQEKLASLKYLNMVLCETLRRNPLGGFLNRVCTRDYVIDETGLKIEKGTPLWVSIDAIHIDPNYFPNPQKFDPERFRNGTKELENAGVFIPFGLGQRRCIGERYTQAAIKIALIYVLRKFRIEPCHLTEETVELDTKTTSTSAKNGIKLRIHKL